MATNLGTGSSSNGRDSNPKNLGVKRYAGEFVQAGTIIVRQRGTYFKDDKLLTTGLGKDHTVFAKIPGFVFFTKKTIGGKQRVVVGIAGINLDKVDHSSIEQTHVDTIKTKKKKVS